MAVTMRAAIRFDMSFVVNLDNDEVNVAVREHDDAEGDVAQASVIEARERVHTMIAKSLGHAFDVDEVNVRDVVMSNVCDACGENPGGDYEPGNGETLCGVCVNRALAFRCAWDILTRVDEYDVAMAHTLAILDEDDARMRASGTQYVDSLSASWDMMRGETYDGVVRNLDPIIGMIVNATRDPGDVA